MYSLRWFLTTQLLASLASTQNCYMPNGNLVSNLKACSVASGNDAAACCFADHYCMTNGLCLSPTEGTWYRGGCTDSQFEQSGCPKFCGDDVIGGVANAHCGVWACASRIFACGSLNNCDRQNFSTGAYRAVMNAAISTDLFDSGATSTTSVASSTSTSTEGASTETCPPPTEQATSGISAGAAAGIGVGVGLPLAITIGALTLMLLREKRKSRGVQAGYPQQYQYPQQLQYNTQPGWVKPEGQFHSPAEAPGPIYAYELGDTQGRPELGR
ncbi:hypothetical protein KVR01_007100 [Diaporthe batatas]|uniref:uncharacterized protein n=1 Tax=Diaporthe batatas TaxID=748121 RepID=UPI001D04B99F|nr:uncharacterized protein KVR01_007100 [Diaporthe batatas]KAG8162622.1 hypothetical protein KVR01_007100 [Diaporthe batatas]